MNIGKTIKELRKERGLSQGELADRVKLSQTPLSRISSRLVCRILRRRD